jgi:hypothetical protein
MHQVLLQMFARAQAAELDVACEKWQTMPGGGRRTTHNDTLEFIGWLREASPVDVRMQAPGDAKGLAPTWRLRQLSLYVKPNMVDCPDADDANSAVRHALLLLARKHNTIYEKIISRVDVQEE